MPTNHSTRERESRSTWYVAPLVWAAITALSFVIAPNWRDVLAEPAQGRKPESATLPATPNVSADATLVPSPSR